MANETFSAVGFPLVSLGDVQTRKVLLYSYTANISHHESTEEDKSPERVDRDDKWQAKCEIKAVRKKCEESEESRMKKQQKAKKTFRVSE